MRKSAVSLLTLIILLISCEGASTDMPTDITPTASVPVAIYSPAPETEEEDKAREISEFHPIVYDGFLLGGSSETGWLNASDFASSLQGGEFYNIYSPESYVGTATGSAVLPDTQQGPYAEEIVIDGAKTDSIAVSCEWDCMPRSAVAQSLENEEYIKIVDGILKEHELAEPVVEIMQSFRIDLDDDGIDEVIIYAEHTELLHDKDWKFSANKGSYSLLFMRKIVDTYVKTYFIQADIWSVGVDSSFPFRNLYGICGFYDLNGDGIMEIVTKHEYYEGLGYNVWELSDSGVRWVIGNGFYV